MPRSQPPATGTPEVAEKSAGKKRPAMFAAPTAQKLHPVQVEFTWPQGVRTDVERELPLDLDDGAEEVLEAFSEPPTWIDRFAPLSAMVNADKLSGKNPLEVELKFIQKLVVHLTKIGGEMERVSKLRFSEKGPVSFLGLGIDPETMVRIVEYDFETADNTYSRLDALFAKGWVSPVATTPFHTLLPYLKHDFELRLTIRLGLDFYWPLVKKYNRAVAKNTGEKYFIMVFWLPEGAYSARVLQMLHQEFAKRCEAEKIAPAHLVLLLDTEQSKESEQELLMKRWNTIRPSPTTRDLVTIMYRERAFSEWVIAGHPSTKKQLDRTIAKVDSGLRDTGRDHLWAHFEPLEVLLGTFKTCNNFEQKLLKLTELGYQPASPDVFVRRKLLKQYGMEENEPRRTALVDYTCWNSYADMPASISRYKGTEEFTPGTVELAPDRPFVKRLAGGGSTGDPGNQCWKPALWAALNRVYRAVVGEPKTFMGGMLGLLRELTPIERVPVAMRNIEEFLLLYGRIRWREHYVAQVCSEADISLEEFCRDSLLKDAPDDDAEMTEEAMASAGVAAEAIFLANEGISSCGFAWENMDQRSTYQNVAMLSLAVSHAIVALQWNDRKKEAQELFAVFEEELLDFRNAYKRHGIDKLDVDLETWEKSIASEVEDSPLNVVTRAARRVAARHLRPAGFRAKFGPHDEHITTSTGHIWSWEVEHENFRWEVEHFCGLAEE